MIISQKNLEIKYVEVSLKVFFFNPLYTCTLNFTLAMALLNAAPQTAESPEEAQLVHKPAKATLADNAPTGFAKAEAFDAATFRKQHQDFKNNAALDPSQASEGRVVYNQSADDVTRSGPPLKRHKKGDVGVLEGKKKYKGPWAAYDDEASSEEEDNSEESEREEDDNKDVVIADGSDEPLAIKETSVLHAKGTDYLGRSYMHIPQDLGVKLTRDPGETEWQVPTRKAHTYTGHTGGVNALSLFPKSGHLLLSCGNDSKIKLWDIYHKRELLRSYSGHSRAVKDICFNNDGTKFLSASYDKTIKLWDTETGECLAQFTTGKIPNAVKFNPSDNNEFLAAMSDRKIIHWDIKTKDIIQTYDHHLGPVNTITFVDENRRFMTTSDDKTVRVWDIRINVPIKFIADPAQHSMPSVQIHPSGNHVAAQSMDNQIVVFAAKDRFRQNRKKTFTGASSAGYAIEVNFSADGKYLMSGDTSGNAYFWDWKTCKLKSSFKAHDSALRCIAAHPQEASKLVSAGRGSEIKLWE